MKGSLAAVALMASLSLSLVARSAPRGAERLPARNLPAARLPAQTQVITPTDSSSESSKAPTSGAGATASKPSGVAAVVVNEEAVVYSAPDFDAPILTTAHRGDRIRVSRGTVGDYAKFHKARVGAVLGYISTMDVQLEGGVSTTEPRAKAKPALGRKAKSAKRAAQEKKARKNARSSQEPKRERLPIYFTRYVGLLVGQSSFKEDIAGQAETASLLIYGVKITGPDTLLQGPVTDFNLALHYGAPSYYDTRSVDRPTGFVLFTDALLLLPYFQRDDFVGYIGFGPLLVLSSFKVTSANDVYDLTTLNAGLSVSTGLGARYDKVALRLEGKYLFEKKSNLAFQASLQTEF